MSDTLQKLINQAEGKLACTSSYEWLLNELKALATQPTQSAAPAVLGHARLVDGGRLKPKPWKMDEAAPAETLSDFQHAEIVRLASYPNNGETVAEYVETLIVATRRTAPAVQEAGMVELGLSGIAVPKADAKGSLPAFEACREQSVDGPIQHSLTVMQVQEAIQATWIHQECTHCDGDDIDEVNLTKLLNTLLAAARQPSEHKHDDAEQVTNCPICSPYEAVNAAVERGRSEGLQGAARHFESKVYGIFHPQQIALVLRALASQEPDKEAKAG